MVWCKPNVVWDDLKVLHLTKLWNRGDPTNEIAEIMGLSRNAVIGKAHRLKLRPRPNPVKPKPVKRQTEQGRSMKGASRNPLKFGKTGNNVKTGSHNLKIDGTLYGPGKTLLEIGPKECRWPCGEIFCAAPTEESVYCEQHTKIAFKPHPKKDKDDE
jgi:GcrA cell cycle regulator